MSVILNALGRPEPSVEVTRRLKAIHSGLHLRYKGYGSDSYWSVCMTWQRDDGRWEYVQSGALDPDSSYDIIGYLPMGCGVDEAPAYLERMLRTFPREDIQRIADHVTNFNANDVLKEKVEGLIGEVLDQADPSKF